MLWREGALGRHPGALAGILMLFFVATCSAAAEEKPSMGQQVRRSSGSGSAHRLGRIRSPSPEPVVGTRLSCGGTGSAPPINPVLSGGALRAGSRSGMSSPAPEKLGLNPMRGGPRPSAGPSAYDSSFLYSTPIMDEYPRDYFGISTRGMLMPSELSMKNTPIYQPEEVSGFCTEMGLDYWGTPAEWLDEPVPERAVFCSQTLNMRSVKLIGYDMDYTLIHYKVKEWEGRAYFYAKANLRQVGFPVDELEFHPELVSRGLIIDKEKGNMIKVDRFGKVRRAMHGLKRYSFKDMQEVYDDEVVDLKNQRFIFLNTLFSVSEGCLYLQLVDLYDQGRLEVKDDRTGESLKFTYEMLFNAVSKSLFKAHVEGRLKADVMESPEKYVDLDPQLPLTLLDQREAGKKLALITNSEWKYTCVMMSNVFNRFLPHGYTWRDLFDVIIVNARKPSFFTHQMPVYEIVTEDGLMRERMKIEHGRIYSGGSAAMVEKLFGVSGEDVCYIGDHIFTDVNVAKVHQKWKTVLIVREFEDEVRAMEEGKEDYRKLLLLMKWKDRISNLINHLRLELNRYAMGRDSLLNRVPIATVHEKIARLLVTVVSVENQIVPLIYDHGKHFSYNWGYMSRAGLVDKSHLMRQIEKYADLYTSRVSNFLRYTPYMYFRSSQLSLAHSPKVSPGHKEWQAEVAGRGGETLRGNRPWGRQASVVAGEGELSEMLSQSKIDAGGGGADDSWRRSLFDAEAAKAVSPVGGRRPSTQRKPLIRVGSNKEFGEQDIGPSGVRLLDVNEDSEPEEGIVDLGWDHAEISHSAVLESDEQDARPDQTGSFSIGRTDSTSI